MSLNHVYWPTLSWGCRLYVLSFLTLQEICILGCTNKAAYVTFLREVDARVGKAMNPHRFLPPGYFTPSSMHKTCLVSYPRSGNSFVRRKLEQATGIITGSDSRTNRTLSKALLRCGFLGEGVCDDSVFIVKSHFPERLGYRIFSSHRILLLVRNPFAAIESYFHMGLTNSHNKSLSDRVRYSSEITSLFQDFLLNEINVWKDFHQYWLNEAKKLGLPLLIIRFEDILYQSRSSGSEMSKDGVLREILEFLRSDKECILNDLLTKICSRDNERYHTDHENGINEGARGPGYSPRNNEDSLASSLNSYTEQQIELISSGLKDLLCIFGYSVKRTINVDDTDSCKFTLCLTPLRQELTQINGCEDEGHNHKVASMPTAKINRNICVRKPDDKYGRHFTKLRKSLTQGDSLPLECKM